MAEFVRKTDGSDVRLRRPHKGVVMGNNPGLLGYIKNFATKYQHVAYGHLLSLEIFVPDDELARAAGFAPHVKLGGLVELTLVEDGEVAPPSSLPDQTTDGPGKISIPSPTATWTPIGGDDSDPAGEEEDDDDYEDDTSGPPPVIPPTSEPGAADDEYQENEKNKPYCGESLSASAADLLYRLQHGLGNLDG